MDEEIKPGHPGLSKPISLRSDGLIDSINAMEEWGKDSCGDALSGDSAKLRRSTAGCCWGFAAKIQVQPPMTRFMASD